jgi:hypothetical protein
MQAKRIVLTRPRSTTLRLCRIHIEESEIEKKRTVFVRIVMSNEVVLPKRRETSSRSNRNKPRKKNRNKIPRKEKMKLNEHKETYKGNVYRPGTSLEQRVQDNEREKTPAWRDLGSSLYSSWRRYNKLF